MSIAMVDCAFVRRTSAFTLSGFAVRSLGIVWSVVSNGSDKSGIWKKKCDFLFSLLFSREPNHQERACDGCEAARVGSLPAKTATAMRSSGAHTRFDQLREGKLDGALEQTSWPFHHLLAEPSASLLPLLPFPSSPGPLGRAGRRAVATRRACILLGDRGAYVDRRLNPKGLGTRRPRGGNSGRARWATLHQPAGLPQPAGLHQHFTLPSAQRQSSSSATTTTRPSLPVTHSDAFTRLLMYVAMPPSRPSACFPGFPHPWLASM